MNKRELVVHLAKKTGLPKDRCHSVINALFGTRSRAGLIEAALDANNKVVIHGFGRFSTRIRPASSRISPTTGERITSPAKTCVYFKAGKNLRDRVAAMGQEAVQSVARTEA